MIIVGEKQTPHRQNKHAEFSVSHITPCAAARSRAKNQQLMGGRSMYLAASHAAMVSGGAQPRVRVPIAAAIPSPRPFDSGRGSEFPVSQTKLGRSAGSSQPPGLMARCGKITALPLAHLGSGCLKKKRKKKKTGSPH